MVDEVQQEQKDWRERFRAVAQAQAQYLYILLIVGLFFAVLGDSKGWSLKTAADVQDLSLLGTKINTRTLLAAGPPVLAFLLLAALGTFPAATYAFERASEGLVDDGRLFERLDPVPTALDLVAYQGFSIEKRWHFEFLLYPVCLWLAYIEAIVLAVSSVRAYATLNITQWVLTVSGIVLLLKVVPGIFSLSWSKIRMAFHKNDNP